MFDIDYWPGPHARQAKNDQSNEQTQHSAMASQQQPDKIHKFPERFHYVLEEVEKDGLTDIVGWHENGKSVLIRDKKRFTADIIP